MKARDNYITADFADLGYAVGLAFMAQYNVVYVEIRPFKVAAFPGPVILHYCHHKPCDLPPGKVLGKIREDHNLTVAVVRAQEMASKLWAWSGVQW